MNRINHIFKKVSYSIFVIIMFWAIAGLLFGFGIVQSLQSPPPWVTFFSHLGDAPAVVGICVLLVIIPRSRNTIAMQVCASLIVAAAIYMVLKIIFSPEPQTLWQLLSGTNNGFPSGHAINNASLYTMLLIQTSVYLRNPHAKILLSFLYMSLAMLAGISRIILSIHRPGDVLGGWLIGNVVAFLVFFIINAAHSRHQNNSGLNH